MYGYLLFTYSIVFNNRFRVTNLSFLASIEAEDCVFISWSLYVKIIQSPCHSTGNVMLDLQVAMRKYP
mgnify:CR=1 FL=1